MFRCGNVAMAHSGGNLNICITLLLRHFLEGQGQYLEELSSLVEFSGGFENCPRCSLSMFYPLEDGTSSN